MIDDLELHKTTAHPEPNEGSSQLKATPFDPAAPLPGDYAIVEVLGHRRYAGRVSEVQRFGATFLQIEPLFRDVLLPPVLIGGSSLYQFTACSVAIAWEHRALDSYYLQGGLGYVAAALTPSLEPPEPEFKPRFLDYGIGEEGE